MKQATQISFRLEYCLSSIFLCLILALTHFASAQQAHPGRGAMSAQEIGRLTAPVAKGSDAADQVCARFAAGSVVMATPELKSQSGVLEVTMNFLTTTDSQGLVRYCYVTSTGLEAPTLRVNPGDTLIIHFKNELPAVTSSSTSDHMAGMNMTLSSQDTVATNTTSASKSNSSACSGAMSIVATNIHFHGMNVPPVCGQDEVVHTLVQPGQSFDYRVQIPDNEPPGLYWYHPHPHGYSEGQVQGGATGALIVEGLQDVDPPVAGLRERTFVLRDQLVPNSELNDSNVPAWDLSINYVPVVYPGYTPAIIQTNPGQQELWRVANTAADTIMDLQYVVNGTAQALQVIAIDGYPIASGSSGLTYESETSILMPPGSRAEFVVTTPNVGGKAQLTTLYWNTGPDGDYDPTRTLATIISQNGAEGASVAGSTAVKKLPAKAAATRVTRFAELSSAIPVAQRTLNFSEVLEDPSNPAGPTNFYITEEGQTPALFTMDQQPNIVVHSGTVEDWVVQNTAGEDHIFHIHQIHFQVLEVNGQAVNDPAIRDTVDLPYWNGSGAYPSVKLRMDFRDPNIIGNFVYHCHILAHEDGGMMGEIEVLPSTGSTSLTVATASSASVNPNGNITLTASVVDKATGKPTPTGLVQFQINGSTVGNPVALVSGQATLVTMINGNSGANRVTAFYEGDSTYAESLSSGLPLTISNFAMTSRGVTAAVGAAAIAQVTVNVASDYKTPIDFKCTVPSTLAESACFVDPNSMTGTGTVHLTLNSTPAHPTTSSRSSRPSWLVAGGGTSLACIFLFIFPRRKWRGQLMLISAVTTALFMAIGCSSGSTKTDPGTAKGTYTMVVTATSGTGSAAYQTSVNVPITLQ